ncbi:ATP-dependent zinc protease [Vibrio pectenicida]|uniref:ATP-dependent zinc protease n=1 Tax=Vibrio pectenicida TaxID=62763 RepID=A0A7Y3ZYI3_9VIBR|nr:ATP-dependent zinc protease [Vibrio pectenicida]NOH71385.1 ATP-dependent zinc protease [Vibrio pectenicida]
MDKTSKALVAMLLSGGLMACSTTSQQPKDPQPKPVIEEPQPEEPKAKPDNSKADKNSQVAEKPKPVKPKPQPKKTADGKLILGQQEWVYVPGFEENFKARIDTGATTSSISATDVVEFERDGQDWVKFNIEHDGTKSKQMALPVVRWVKVRQSSSEKSQRRAVVESWVQLGDLKEKTEFTLADRTHLKYPLLLGRSFVTDVAIVDVSKEFVQKKHK